MEDLYRKILKTPLGDLVIIASYEGLLLVGFSDQPKLGKQMRGLENATQSQNEHIQHFENELALYFEGKLRAFTTPCMWNRGTLFQQRTWQILERIPYGQTVNYAQVAASIHHPTAYRAVANANGSNPFIIRVPCHRVIKSSGDLCGYNAGMHRKEWLLNHEKQHAHE